MKKRVDGRLFGGAEYPGRQQMTPSRRKLSRILSLESLRYIMTRPLDSYEMLTEGIKASK